LRGDANGGLLPSLVGGLRVVGRFAGSGQTVWSGWTRHVHAEGDEG
jgi:hypothetical protein